MSGPERQLVDVHSHFVTPEYVEAATRAGHVHPEGMPRWATWSVPEHLAMMDEAGIARAVLSVSSPGTHFGNDAAARALARSLNRFSAGVVERFPDRFGHFAALPMPDVAGALAEATYALDELGAAGVAVLSNAHGVYPGDPRYAELYAELDRRGAIVFVHPVSPPNWERVSGGRPRPMLEFIFDSARAAADLVLSGTVHRHRNIRWVFSHSGGALPVLAERLELFRGLLPEQVPGPAVDEQLAGFWYDIAGTPFPHAAPALARAFGDDRVLYGSDYCWTPAAGALAQARTVDPAWRALTTRNANRLLDERHRPRGERAGGARPRTPAIAVLPGL
ncbi:amidohydrolase family protein [Dactylosporangium sp. NPDC049742]|uniref:amidohydrolase family protein n=1 Tax=Dactylosporangium sp. NPDC049742 TaxID=3154737 RepID=UPI0034302357